VKEKKVNVDSRSGKELPDLVKKSKEDVSEWLSSPEWTPVKEDEMDVEKPAFTPVTLPYPPMPTRKVVDPKKLPVMLPKTDLKTKLPDKRKALKQEVEPTPEKGIATKVLSTDIIDEALQAERVAGQSIMKGKLKDDIIKLFAEEWKMTLDPTKDAGKRLFILLECYSNACALSYGTTVRRLLLPTMTQEEEDDPKSRKKYAVAVHTVETPSK